MDKQSRNTRLFALFLALAGALRLLEVCVPKTAVTCAQYLIYIGLLLFWMESVRVRLLPSKARSYMIAAPPRRREKAMSKTAPMGRSLLN